VQKPFIKWVGGKRQLLPELRARVPVQYGHYFEPFVGGGALFFDLLPECATLCDANERLVRTYKGVRNDVEQVIELLASYPHENAFFYELRAVAVDACTDAEVAAWFIYLNRVGFNGLYRVNQSGGFNVPFGSHKNPTICDADTLRACSRALKSAELRVSDFAASVTEAQAGDLVYFDPPYAPLSATSSFTTYTAGGFGPTEQRRLRDLALELKRRGVHVLLSNSSAPLIRDLYADGFHVEEVGARRAVNSKASGRGLVKELLIR
jgi:DNA adenine methylase